MTTLSDTKPRPFEGGDINQLLVIASDVIYEGAAVGIVAGTGHARPLTAGDAFAGFCVETCDNSSGLAAAKSVTVRERGKAQLPVTSVAITDIGAPVYASDDDTFVLTATDNSLVGYVHRFVSSGIAVVAFDAKLAGIQGAAATDIAELLASLRASGVIATSS